MNISGIFSFESPLWQFLGRVADAFILTILWFLCSLPIITLGASTTALYAATLRMMRNEDTGIVKRFFQDFKTNLVQGSIAGIVMLLVGLALGYNLVILYKNPSEGSSILMVAMLVFTYVYLMLFKYIFAVIARFSNNLPSLFIMAFMFSVKYFGWTLLMITILVCLIVLSIFVFWPILLFLAGAVALIDSLMLNKVFEEHIIKNNIM